ncbi:MAG: hypothetical protein J6B29_02335 [Clostridia bacterium]|nr:hypothetical protein [Clostridia bacterium]
MSNVTVDFTKEIGKIKVMHAVNNGPVVAGADQTRGNQDYYRAARIPYARTHDASFYAGYGGEHTIDVRNIFTDFSADENDSNNYDFACTDQYIKQIFTYGSKPFYRLGTKIEHEVKKYGSIMPPDFAKWARICEHIIAHYTEGWADGFFYDIEYWEIWNEPDLDSDDSENKRCWSGTEEDFARFYTVASTHLKSRFPHLKIGGPASAGDEAWMVRFFDRIKKDHPPIDFFSWHWYWTMPDDVSRKATKIRKILVDAGYKDAESILNEWNYVRGWTDEFVYSIQQIIGMKGAAFTSACMSICQHNPDVDMLMYYDARPGTFNGLFDYYTMKPLKGYYPFYLFANLYELGTQAESFSDDESVYCVGAVGNGKRACMVTYYTENDDEGAKKVSITLKGAVLDNLQLFILDEENTMSKAIRYTVQGDTVSIRLERNSILYIEA